MLVLNILIWYFLNRGPSIEFIYLYILQFSFNARLPWITPLYAKQHNFDFYWICDLGYSPSKFMIHPIHNKQSIPSYRNNFVLYIDLLHAIVDDNHYYMNVPSMNNGNFHMLSIPDQQDIMLILALNSLRILAKYGFLFYCIWFISS